MKVASQIVRLVAEGVHRLADAPAGLGGNAWILVEHTRETGAMGALTRSSVATATAQHHLDGEEPS